MIKSLQISIIFSLIFSAMICGGCRTVKNSAIPDERIIFNSELQNIIQQQSKIREEQILHSLRKENSQAATLSNIAEFELMLDNYELSSEEKNKALLKYFETANLYMQFLLMPEKKQTLLNKYVKKQLTFELASLFLRKSTAEMLLNTLDGNSAEAIRIGNNWQNTISNCKIEYDALRINDLNAAKLLPDIYYPMHPDKPDITLDLYRRQSSEGAKLYKTALDTYTELRKKYEEKFPLVLLRLTFEAPHKINYLCGNDTDMKNDFALFLSEIIRIYTSEVLFNSMQNSYNITADFQQAVRKEKNPSAQMLDGCYKSIIIYELAYLQMLTYAELSPFENWRLPEDDIPELPQQKISALKYLLSEVLKNI